MTTRDATLKIPVLHCESCAKTVARTLQPLPSVEITHTDVDAKLVHVRYDESAVSLDRIRDALDEIGFSPQE